MIRQQCIKTLFKRALDNYIPANMTLVSDFLATLECNSSVLAVLNPVYQNRNVNFRDVKTTLRKANSEPLSNIGLSICLQYTRSHVKTCTL